MVDIIHKVGIKAPISKVYAALATVEGVAGWWTRHTTGDSKPGSALTVVFHHRNGEQVGKAAFDIAKLDPNRAVAWRFTAGPEEWIGTDVTFDLKQDGEFTLVSFGHKNWREAVDFMGHCSMKWATFLLSLKELAETGTGKPSPEDLKIDNWN